MVSPESTGIDRVDPGGQSAGVGAAGEDPGGLIGSRGASGIEGEMNLTGEVGQILDSVFQVEQLEILDGKLFVR